MTELRDVWHGFESGRVGPEGVVAAARRACGSGLQRRAPSLVQLANLQPTQHGYVSELFGRVRSELQAAAAAAREQPVQTPAPPQLAYAAANGQQAYGAANGQPSYGQPSHGMSNGTSNGQPAYGSPQPAQQAYAQAAPAAYAAPGAYPMQPGYPGQLAPAPVGYMPVEPGLPPGVHGISPKELKELRRTGWICAVASLLIGLLAIVSIVNGQKLAKAGDGHGTPMMIVGTIMLGLTVISVMMLASSS